MASEAERLTPASTSFAVHLGRVDCAEDRPVENRTNALCPRLALQDGQDSRGIQDDLVRHFSRPFSRAPAWLAAPDLPLPVRARLRLVARQSIHRTAAAPAQPAPRVHPECELAGRRNSRLAGRRPQLQEEACHRKTELSFANLCRDQHRTAGSAGRRHTNLQRARRQAKPVLLTADEDVKAAAAAVLAAANTRPEPMRPCCCTRQKAWRRSGSHRWPRQTGQSHRPRRAQRGRNRRPLRQAARPARLVFALPESSLLPPGPCVRARGRGRFLGDFDPDTYRSDRKDVSVQSFTLAAPAKEMIPPTRPPSRPPLPRA
jgi:hypothetical protein